MRRLRPLLITLGVVAAVWLATIPVRTQSGTGLTRLSAVAATDVRDWDNRLIRMERDGMLKSRRSDPDTMLPGRTHERLDQYYSGIPVWGGEALRQTDSQGTAVTVFGSLYSGFSLDVTPTLTPADAAKVFERATGHQPSAGLQPALWILPKDEGAVLVYLATEFTGTELPVLFINAKTGVVEQRYDNLQRQTPAVGSGTGVLGDTKKVSTAAYAGAYVADDLMRPPLLMTYDMKGVFSRTYAILAGATTPSWADVATSTNNTWTDGAAVDGHTYIGWTYDYYYKRFGRRGLDNSNKPMRAIVHPVGPTDPNYAARYSIYVRNAFWCATCGADGRGYMVFGDGNRPGYYDGDLGQKFAPLAGALDVVAHELTHAVTTSTSNLTYAGESGALNEAFSDMMGVSAEFFYQSTGSGQLKADYVLGEDVVTAYLPGTLSGSRSLADPKVYGDPDHYSLRLIGPYDEAHDYGYVHSNSLIGGHAFYLAIEGGTNRTSKLSVTGVGAANREQIEKVFYRGFTYYLTSNATFSTARAATIRAAQDLYGIGSAVERAVTQAWTAVGVN